MRRSLVLLVPVLVAGLLSACTADSESSTPPGSVAPTGTSPEATDAASDDLASWMYVVSADAGTADGGTITLTGVRPEVDAFTDRPIRAVNRLETGDLVSSWATEGFDADPPNAAMTASAGGVERTSTFTMADPSWDQDSSTLTFSYQELGDVIGTTKIIHNGPRGAPDATFERVSLFIDAGGPTATIQQGSAEVTPLSPRDWEIELENAKAVSPTPCHEPGFGLLELCAVLLDYRPPTYAGWSIIVKVPGDAAGSGSATLTADDPSSNFHAEAVVPITPGATQFFRIDWMTPEIKIPAGTEGVQLDAVVRVGPGSGTYLTCRAGPSTYYCTGHQSIPPLGAP